MSMRVEKSSVDQVIVGYYHSKFLVHNSTICNNVCESTVVFGLLMC
jgi:hypothetical protein